MASVYTRPKSKYWWIKYRAPSGKVVRESTKFRHDLPIQTRQAKALEAQKTVDELKHWRADERERWEFWVQEWIHVRYEQSPKTMLRYTTAWERLYAYLSLKKILYPRQLSYTDCISYLSWRKGGDKKHGIPKGHHNTARLELKILGTILKEAIRRGFALANPATALHIERIHPDEKPEIPDDHLGIIFEELKARPEWMQTGFLVSLYTGCRFAETSIRFSDIDMESRRIYFRNPKGGRDRAFSVPIRENLYPVLQRLKSDGRERTYEIPFMAGKEWWKFFVEMSQKHKFPHYCFHCLRVTFITRGARSGVDQREMMRLVNHADRTIHKIYLRFRVEDLVKPLHQIQLPQF